LRFSSSIDVPIEHMFRVCIDYEKIPNYLPGQVKSIKIIETKNNQVTTEDTIVFSSLVKNLIQQQSIHKQISNNELSTEIISGPAKGTILNLTLKKNDCDTEIDIDVELKLSLKAKFLEPVIRLWYKRVIKSILFTIAAEFRKQKNKNNELGNTI